MTGKIEHSSNIGYTFHPTYLDRLLPYYRWKNTKEMELFPVVTYLYTEKCKSKMAKMPCGDNFIIELIVLPSWMNFYNEFFLKYTHGLDYSGITWGCRRTSLLE